MRKERSGPRAQVKRRGQAPGWQPEGWLADKRRLHPLRSKAGGAQGPQRWRRPLSRWIGWAGARAEAGARLVTAKATGRRPSSVAFAPSTVAVQSSVLQYLPYRVEGVESEYTCRREGGDTCAIFSSTLAVRVPAHAGLAGLGGRSLAAAGLRCGLFGHRSWHKRRHALSTVCRRASWSGHPSHVFRAVRLLARRSLDPLKLDAVANSDFTFVRTGGAVVHEHVGRQIVRFDESKPASGVVLDHLAQQTLRRPWRHIFFCGRLWLPAFANRLWFFSSTAIRANSVVSACELAECWLSSLPLARNFHGRRPLARRRGRGLGRTCVVGLTTQSEGARGGAGTPSFGSSATVP